MKIKLLVVGVMMVALIAGLQADASATITILADQAAAQAAGQDGFGDFVAELTLTGSQLKIALDNTTAAQYGGVIVRYDFNNPGNAIQSLTLDSASAGYADLNYSVNDSPFGTFDYSVDLRDTPAYPGLGINDGIVEYIFNVTLNQGKSLTELAFTNEYSTGGNYSAFFFARFQSMDERLGSGSDKVPGKTDGGDPVPEPATMLLLGPAMFLLGAFRKRS